MEHIDGHAQDPAEKARKIVLTQYDNCTCPHLEIINDLGDVIVQEQHVEIESADSTTFVFKIVQSEGHDAGWY